MKLSDLGEHRLIARVTGGLAVDETRVLRGVGDDCSVTRLPNGQLQAVTTDMLVEDVHFRRASITPRQLGHRVVAVNLSDVAAMGATPRDAWLSIALPGELEVDWVDELFAGIAEAAARYGVNLLGGNTSRGNTVVLNLTVLGEVAASEILLRDAAQIGDRIFVTGSLGDAAAGLDAARHGHQAPTLLRHHLEPTPHVEVGRRIATSGHARAAIDVSDGLAADLGHVCDASGVGCRIDAERLPLSTELRTYCATHSLDPLELALGGGEDYVLLVTGAPALAQLEGLVEVGEITEDGGRVILVDGEATVLEARGWDHLRD